MQPLLSFSHSSHGFLSATFVQILQNFLLFVQISTPPSVSFARMLNEILYSRLRYNVMRQSLFPTRVHSRAFQHLNCQTVTSKTLQVVQLMAILQPDLIQVTSLLLP